MKNQIKDKVTQIMYGNGPTGNQLLRAVLRTISVFYTAGVRMRGAAYRFRIKSVRKLPCLVISVGNITVGGTGKSPMVIYLAKMLRGMGYELAVLSRGYKGAAEKSGGLVSDGQSLLMGAEAAGDEPFMLARTLLAYGVPVMVGQDRYRSGMRAVGHFRPHVVLLDDGFQHRRLHRDLDIVLLDGEQPLGNGHLFPRGTLREPPAALKRADLVVMTRCDRASSKGLQNSLDLLKKIAPTRPVFRTRHQPRLYASVSKAGPEDSFESGQSTAPPTPEHLLSQKRVYAFSGIARNSDFRHTLEALGADLTGFKSFPDHYQYTAADMKMLHSEALERNTDCFVTTQKDYCRFGSYLELPVDLIVIGVRIDFRDQVQSFRNAVVEHLPPLSH